MTLSAKLANEIDTAVKTILKKLWEPLLRPDAMIWHYTTGDTAIKVLNSGKIWTTQVSGLNDSLELRYAAMLYKESLISVAKSSPDGKTKDFIQRYIGLIQDSDSIPLHAVSMFFVACFSEKKDDLNLWRAYGGSENGVALGFQVQDLAGPWRQFGRVNYNSNLQKELADLLAKSAAEAYAESRPENATSDWDDLFLENWDTRIGALSPFVKNPRFSDEAEVRLVRPYLPEDLPSVQFMQKRTLISRHLPITIGPQSEGVSSQLPLKEIVIGPGRHQHISSVSLNLLLQQRGYTNVILTKSTCPLQEV